MDKKTFIIVLVHLALAAQGLDDQNIDGELKQIFFRLRTSNMSPGQYRDIKADSAAGVSTELKNHGLIPNTKTKIFIHGYTHSADTITDQFANAYDTANEPFNLIVVDWSQIAKLPRYEFALKSVEKVGGSICNRLTKAVLSAGVKHAKVHLIGHGLGALVSGPAVRCLTKEVGRITALDPDNTGTSGAISKDDAKLVDVIHVNGGSLNEGCIGSPLVLGHLNFFLNRHRQSYRNDGFNYQHVPGCQDEVYTSIRDLAQSYDQAKSCSHEAALAIYKESITNDKSFQSFQCAAWRNYGRGHGIGPVGRKCLRPLTEELFVGDRLNVKKARKLLGDPKFFLTTTDGANGKYSRDTFKLYL